MEDFYPTDYTDEMWDLVSMYITEESEFEENFLKAADDKKPYCIAEQDEVSVLFDEEYAVFTQAAFLRECYERYMTVGIEYLIDAYLGESEAEDMETLMDEVCPEYFSFEYFLSYAVRYDGGYRFLVADSYTAGDEKDKKDVENTVKEFGDIEKVDFDLKKVEESL